MLTRAEAERLAEAVHALRADWPVASLVAFLKDRKDKPLLDISLQLVWVALDADTKTPARIDQDGPWKSVGLARAPKPVHVIADDDCAICFRPLLATHDGHAYEPQHARAGSVGMSEGQRAAIEAARVEAELAKTAEREAEEERTHRSASEVLAQRNEASE